MYFMEMSSLIYLWMEHLFLYLQGRQLLVCARTVEYAHRPSYNDLSFINARVDMFSNGD